MWVGDAVRRDVTQVTKVPKIGSERAKELAKAGIFAVNDLAEADPEDVANQTNLGEPLLKERIKHVRSNQIK